ncbi:winged helix domain-containing protein [Xaviernesmea rhizosphaerae]
MTVRILPEGQPITVAGRNLWALRLLMKAGKDGCTPIEQPGPRWSDYTHKLRKFGFAIETVHETHGGPFPGTHARYILHSQVETIPEEGSAVNV